MNYSFAFSRVYIHRKYSMFSIWFLRSYRWPVDDSYSNIGYFNHNDIDNGWIFSWYYTNVSGIIWFYETKLFVDTDQLFLFIHCKCFLQLNI